MPEPEITAVTPKDNADRLTRRHGPPWMLTKTNRIEGINEEWWAALIRDEANVVHDRDEGLFGWDDLSGVYEKISPYAIIARISSRLWRVARDGAIPDLAKFRNLSRLRVISEFLRAVSDRADPFHHGKPLLALGNGVVEMTAEGRVLFHKPSPRFLLRHKATVDYDPKARPRRFLTEFLEPMLDEEDLDLLQRHLGLILFGQNPMHRMGILEGETAAGKTTLVNLVIALIGEDRVCQLRTEHLENQFELDAFRGRSLLVGNDVGERFLNTIGAQTLKGLVSTDLYHPEAKNRRERLPLRGPFNVLIGTNCQLSYRSQGDGPAWTRRLILYDCKTPEGRRRIPNFEHLMLREEGPGIINWLIEGHRKASRQIADNGDLEFSDGQRDRVERLILRSDTTEVFVTRCVREEPKGDITSDEAVEAYAEFCKGRGWRPIPQKSFLERFGKMLMERFGRPQRHDLKGEGKKLSRGWSGVELQEASDGFKPF